MISDWIQVRIDLTRDPKVARMLDLLRKSIGSYVLKISPDDLLSGVTCRGTCPVTDLVTGHALRDVIVSALIRVWGTANTFIRDETIIGITLDWIDDVSQIPGFGKAMQKVGWIESTPEDGIRFPNFNEWNRPKTSALRSSSAVRKERQRLRKWLAENPADTPDRHAKMSRLNDIESRLPERDMSRDKSRDCPAPVTPQRKEKEQYSELQLQPSSLDRGIDLNEARTWADTFNRSNTEGTSIPMPVITAWHDDRQSKGWTTVRDGNEFPIRDWQADLRVYARKWQQNERSPRPTNSGQQRAAKPIILTTKPVNGF